MTNEYPCLCEGCQEEITVRVEGYIGIIDEVWCEECGYMGENISDDPIEKNEIISENHELIPMEQIREMIENRIPAKSSESLQETVELSLHLHDTAENPRHLLAFHQAMSKMMKHLV